MYQAVHVNMRVHLAEGPWFISIACCCPVTRALCTNMGLMLLANKLITVCDLCPLPLLTPSRLSCCQADRLRTDGTVWRWEVQGYYYTACVVTQDFSFLLPLFLFLSSGFMPKFTYRFSLFTVNVYSKTKKPEASGVNVAINYLP